MPRKPVAVKAAAAKLARPDPAAARRYQKTQREYVALYGVSLPTIKRWWKAGRPLDDPDAMGEYLSPRGRKPDNAPDFESPSITPPPPPDENGFPVDEEIPIKLGEDFFKGAGVLAAIERLKKAERERAAAYFKAILNRQAPQILANRFKEWTGLIEVLRKVEKDAPEIRKLNELTIDRAEMETAVGQIFQSFRTAANNLPGRAAGKLIGLTERDEILDVLEREVEVLLRTLTDITLESVDKAEAAAAPGDDTPSEA